MAYNSYKSYKTTKNMWFGEIPKEWDLIKSKFCFKLSGGYAFKSEDFIEEGACLIRIGDIKEGSVDLENCKKLPLKYSIMMKDFLVDDDDILIALTGATIGKIGKVPKTNKKILLNQRVGKLHSEYPNYFKYILESDIFQSQIKLISEGSAQENISNEDIGNFEILKVDDMTKLYISDFLDKKTSEIDKKVAKNKELISLLEEKKIALINQCVTKGLNPNVPMKYSGIEWIGEIPEHWDLIKVSKAFNNIGSGTTPKSSVEEYYIGGDVNWLITGDLNDNYIYETSTKITKKAKLENPSLKTYPKDSLVIAMYGATIGKLGILKIKTCTNQACCVLSDSKVINIKYAFYWFLCFKKDIISLSYGGGQPNISQDTIKSLKIIKPPLTFQKEIVNYLDKEISKINKTIRKIEYQIILLEEYKTSLIHNVVTGKIDVRDEI